MLYGSVLFVNAICVLTNIFIRIVPRGISNLMIQVKIDVRVEENEILPDKKH